MRRRGKWSPSRSRAGVAVGDRVVVMPQYPCGLCALCVSGDYIHCEHGYDFAQFTGSPAGSATMAQYLLKPSWLLPRIPDDVPYERASLACCALGPSFNAWQAMGVGADDTVLITGAGPVGLGAVVNARFRGARVLVVEAAPWRAERARQMGAAAVLDPRDHDLVGAGQGADGRRRRGRGPGHVRCRGGPAALPGRYTAQGPGRLCRRVRQPAGGPRQPRLHPHRA